MPLLRHRCLILALGIALVCGTLACQANPPAPLDASTRTPPPAVTPAGPVTPTQEPADVPMVEIPAGPFYLGCADADDPQCHGNYKKMQVAAFSIDKFEVRMDHYRGCVAAGACTPVPEKLAPTEPGLPVAGTDWAQAKAYCAWLGKRLPTSAEWEKAARGIDDSRRYPWGDKWDGRKANWIDGKNGDGSVDGFARWAPVDAFPNGESPYGVRQMAGNQLEWTATEIEVGPMTFVVARGGCWGGFQVGAMGAPDYGLLSWNQTSDPPDLQAEHLGFRCAK